jgi:hypothetical protein
MIELGDTAHPYKGPTIGSPTQQKMGALNEVRPTAISLRLAETEAGKDLILKCIDVFSKELKGFKPKESIFNFPFNASTPELEQWLPSHVKAFRTGGNPINALPHKGQVKLTCTSHGPENINEHLNGEIEKLLALPSGWLIYNTHGLDDEGWGPLSSDFLDRLLARLVEMDSVEIIPAGKALSRIK